MLTSSVALEHPAMKQLATSLRWDLARSTGKWVIVWARPGTEDTMVKFLLSYNIIRRALIGNG